MKFLRSVAGYTRNGQIKITKIKEELNIFNLNYKVLDWWQFWVCRWLTGNYFRKRGQGPFEVILLPEREKSEYNSGRGSKQTSAGADSFVKWFRALKVNSISNAILRSFQSCIISQRSYKAAVLRDILMFITQIRGPRKKFSYLILITNCVNNCLVDSVPAMQSKVAHLP
jgi:hypothetical protein